jgi:hypothetical protein
MGIDLFSMDVIYVVAARVFQLVESGYCKRGAVAEWLFRTPLLFGA